MRRIADVNSSGFMTREKSTEHPSVSPVLRQDAVIPHAVM
jgi:hypothetical protein